MLNFHNPIEDLRLVVKQCYPALDCDVVFVDFEPIEGETVNGVTPYETIRSDRTTDPESGRVVVRLSSDLRIGETLDELAEQLAEVAVQTLDLGGLKAAEVVDMIYEAFQARS